MSQRLSDLPAPDVAAPDPGERTIVAHVVYATYALTFLTGFTALVGVVVAYLNRDAVRGSWLDSHMIWQIRTFWYALAIQVIGWITTLILIGWLIVPLGGLYFIWRIAKGWVRLANHRPVEDPRSFL